MHNVDTGNKSHIYSVIKGIVGGLFLIIWLIALNYNRDAIPNRTDEEFYKQAIVGIVDSVLYNPKPYRRIHRIKVSDRWFILSTDYTNFVTFIAKSDSIFKLNNNANVRIKRKTNTNWEQYKYIFTISTWK